MSNNEKIKQYRNQIDKLDKKLIEILAKRFEVVKKVGIYKKENNISVQDKGREKELLQEKKKIAKEAKISEELVESIFKLIIKESRKKQKNIS